MASSSAGAAAEVTGLQRREAYVVLAKLSSQKLVQAIRGDLFPDEATEKMFGIVMKDTANDGWGDLIYNSWAEIYKRRLFYGGETVNKPPGSASHQFEEELALAITSNILATRFFEWAREVVSDERYPLKVYSTRVLQKLPQLIGMEDSLIHPTNEEHRNWMERFRLELANPAAAGGGGARGNRESTPTSGSNNNTNNNFCDRCGNYGAKKLCSSCKEVSYCNREHQTKAWKNHKGCCKAINANPVSVWIEVEEGEGSGLANNQTNHIFATKADGLQFVREQFGHNNVSPPLRSPFCELTGWNVEIYCSTQQNRITLGGHAAGQLAEGKDWGHLNSAGVYLGCDLNDGLTRHNNLSGTIFVTGRRQKDGQPMNQDVLWGLLNFIYDAMDLYGESMGFPLGETLNEWATRYKEGSWVPKGGDGGVDVYSNHFARHGARDHR